MFEEIKLTWDGREYSVAPNRVLGAIAAVEEHITLVELMRHVVANTTPIARLSFAYGAVLRYAGVRVSNDEVYAWLIGDPNELARMTDCLNTILLMMMPPDARGATGDAHPTKPAKAVARLSRKGIKR